MDKIKITRETTFADLMNFFDSFIVTGLLYNSKKRFVKKMSSPAQALSVNLWRGSVCGVKNGKRQLIKRTYN